MSAVKRALAPVAFKPLVQDIRANPRTDTMYALMKSLLQDTDSVDKAVVRCLRGTQGM